MACQFFRKKKWSYFMERLFELPEKESVDLESLSSDADIVKNQ